MVVCGRSGSSEEDRSESGVCRSALFVSIPPPSRTPYTLGIRRGGLMNLEDECDAEVRIGLIIVDYLSMGWHKPR